MVTCVCLYYRHRMRPLSAVRSYKAEHRTRTLAVETKASAVQARVLTGSPGHVAPASVRLWRGSEASVPRDASLQRPHSSCGTATCCTWTWCTTLTASGCGTPISPAAAGKSRLRVRHPPTRQDARVPRRSGVPGYGGGSSSRVPLSPYRLVLNGFRMPHRMKDRRAPWY